ncbi:MAG: mercury(II) reductase [Nitrospira sp.]|nr:mercury(II) reductase [Nitrospira sp.]
MVKEFDLVILGSGSTAFAAALRAAEHGKTIAMTERRTLGGTCANRGCLPSKNLIEAAKILYDAKHPRYPGLSPTSMCVNFRALIEQKDAVIEDYRGMKYQSILSDSKNIRVFEGAARFSSPDEVTVNGQVLSAPRFLVATGSSPTVPEVSGLRDTPYLTSDLLTSHEDIELTELPASLIIIGGGYIALELGQMFSRFGASVTILERGARILATYEPEIAQSVAEGFREEGIAIYTNTAVSQVQGDARHVVVMIEVNGRQKELKAAKLLVATGRKPNTEHLGLDLPGVDLDARGFVKVNDELRTSAAHVYAAGDVIGSYTGSQMATPVGAQDGGIAADNALNGQGGRKVTHAVIPRAMFTDPQVGVVGLSDAEATARGYECECRIIPMSLVPRAGAVRETRGVLKMVADRRTKQVLGVSMHGMHAAEVIHEAAMGLRFGARIDDFARMLHVYPTMAEALKIAALSYTKDVSKMSCCAE